MKRKLIKPRLKINLSIKNNSMPFWSEIIFTLINQHGLSCLKIAKAVDAPLTIIEDLIYRTGHYPSYEVFDRLVQLYRTVRT